VHGALRPQQVPWARSLTRPAPVVGSCRWASSQPKLCPNRSRRCLVEVADVTVTQPVEHRHQKSAGCSDSGNSSSPCLHDPAIGALDRWPPWKRATASTAAQRASDDPCFVIDPLFTVSSDSRCRGVDKGRNLHTDSFPHASPSVVRPTL